MKTYINDDKHICELTITETREIDGDTVIDTRLFKKASQALNALGKTITEISIYNACIDFEDSRFEIVSKSRIDKINKQRDNLPVIFKYNHFYIKHNGEYYGFQISQLIEVIETLGTNAEIFIHYNSKIYKPLYIKSDIGRAVLLPVKLKDITCIKANKTI